MRLCLMAVASLFLIPWAQAQSFNWQMLDFLTRWRSAKMADLAASTSGFPVDFTLIAANPKNRTLRAAARAPVGLHLQDQG